MLSIILLCIFSCSAPEPHLPKGEDSITVMLKDSPDTTSKNQSIDVALNKQTSTESSYVMNITESTTINKVQTFDVFSVGNTTLPNMMKITHHFKFEGNTVTLYVDNHMLEQSTSREYNIKSIDKKIETKDKYINIFKLEPTETASKGYNDCKLLLYFVKGNVVSASIGDVHYSKSKYTNQ